MEKEILSRGYVTHALTNQDGDIYGMVKDWSINFAENKVERKNTFYWSEVYREETFAMIIRKGQVLVDATPEELHEKFEQSKINLN